MISRDSVIEKLFSSPASETVDVKFFPGVQAVDSADLIWKEFNKALTQFADGRAEVSARWNDNTAKRSLNDFISAN